MNKVTILHKSDKSSTTFLRLATDAYIRRSDYVSSYSNGRMFGCTLDSLNCDTYRVKIDGTSETECVLTICDKDDARPYAYLWAMKMGYDKLFPTVYSISKHEDDHNTYFVMEVAHIGRAKRAPVTRKEKIKNRGRKVPIDPITSRFWSIFECYIDRLRGDSETHSLTKMYKYFNTEDMDLKKYKKLLAGVIYQVHMYMKAFNEYGSMCLYGSERGWDEEKQAYVNLKITRTVDLDMRETTSATFHQEAMFVGKPSRELTYTTLPKTLHLGDMPNIKIHLPVIKHVAASPLAI